MMLRNCKQIMRIKSCNKRCKTLSRRKYIISSRCHINYCERIYSLYHRTTLFSRINRKISRALSWSWGIVLRRKGCGYHRVSRRTSNYSAKDRDGRKQFDESRFTLAQMYLLLSSTLCCWSPTPSLRGRRSLTFLYRGLSVQELLTCSTLVCALSITVRCMSRRALLLLLREKEGEKEKEKCHVFEKLICAW